MRGVLLAIASASLLHCTSPAPPSPADAGSDAGADAPVDDLVAVDAAAPKDVVEPADVLELPTPTDHCVFEPVPPTARAGGVVAEGAVRAGVAERFLDLPVGSALGAYTSRVRALGNAGSVDARERTLAAWFSPSVGYHTRPMAKALALTAGDETVVLLKVDLGSVDQAIVHEVSARLGPSFAGKVLVAASHSHSAPGHTVAHEAYAVLGFGPHRAESHRRLVDVLVEAATAALDARVPARVGVAHEGAFDPTNLVSRDRRESNDDLPNGRRRKDNDLFVVRVDAADGRPLALLPVVGVHPTILDADNNLQSSDASGAIERALEARFDRPVLVMHLQGAAGDVSPAGAGGFDCGAEDRGPARACYDYARVEGLGRAAASMVYAVWERAGAVMRDRVAMEMLTRSVVLGTDWRTFAVRDGGLAYAPFEPGRPADRTVFDDAGAIVSPIDEFNAPFGAALCGNSELSLSGARLPGVEGLRTYQGCQRIEVLSPLIGALLGVRPPPITPGRTACGATRTVVTALRLGDHLFVGLPGEPLTLMADRVRALSPVPADRTVVLGYTNGYSGYLLTAEDWLRAGYEPTLNFWGPLEGEHIAEEAVRLARLAVTPEREDASPGTTRWVPPVPDALPAPDTAPMAGTVPASVPAEVYARRYPDWTAIGAQPPPRVERLGTARFAWVGEDPRAGTPTVRVEVEETPGSDRWRALGRRDGREVRDGDLLVTWTPQPLVRTGAEPVTHYWTVEWQAVPPWGDAAHDALDHRLALPTGRYRYAVEGTGYRVQSRPFEVVAASLRVGVVTAGASATLTITAQSADGWRMLSLRSRPGEALALPAGPVRVELIRADDTRRAIDGVAVDATGRAIVDLGAEAAMVRRVEVTDPYGNRGAGTTD